MLSLKKRRIRTRIVVPFTILMAVTLLCGWLFSSFFVSRFLDRNLEARMSEAAGIISRSGYVLNPAILRKLKGVMDTEIVVADLSGRILRSTFSGRGSTNQVSGILRRLHRPSGLSNRVIGGLSYRMVSRPVRISGRGDVLLSLWKPARDLDRTRWKAVITMGAIAFAGLVAVAVAGFFIARTITAPLEDLAKATEGLARGDWDGVSRLPRGKDELGRLGASFTSMAGRLRDAEKRLVETEKMGAAGQMAAGLAHEIRNPLTSIKMLGQVLKKRFSGQQENQRMTDSLIHEIDRLDRIIQEIIDRTRPGELRKEEVHLNRLIAEVLAVAEAEMAARKIVLKRHFDRNLGPVQGDPGKLKQVVWNLIVNGAEAMPGGGEIVISTGSTDKGPVAVRVEDSGTGIRDGEKQRLFEPFFTTKPEGMGLGLTISRKLVRKHGGTLHLENRNSGGCMAVMLLPPAAPREREEEP